MRNNMNYATANRLHSQSGINPVSLASIHNTALRCRTEGIGLSESAIRRLVKTGDIPCIMVGNKALINWNSLLYFLEQGSEVCHAAVAGAVQYADV
ncbi:MAG: helix-turn-helix domain-containing protein [Ruminococcaceae bacterium]|nr:helix-turn-helix domain-containing protein [Oscillospiraceae bacterium]